GIILPAVTDVAVLVEAISLGQVYRYITKPWDAKEVRGVLQYAIERFHLQRENRRLAAQLAEYTGYLNQQLHGEFDFGNIIGDSAALKEVLAKVEQVAPTASTVLLRGETGTGKELVAHAIHINSPREAKPFVRVNCAALAPGVLESELFGHEKGSFTGAMARPPAPDAVSKLREYNWPGNVRELENIVERAMILARGASLGSHHLDFGRRAATPGAATPGTGPVQAVASPAAPAEDGKSLAERLLDSERKEIVAAVEKSRGHIASASR